MMDRGLYPHYVTVKSVTNTKDDIGGNTISYTELAKVYMSKRDMSGREGMEQLRDTATTTTIFKTAYYISGLTQDHVLELNSVQYDIMIIKELGFRESQEITCTAKY